MSMRNNCFLIAVALLTFCYSVLETSYAETLRVSVASDGREGNDHSSDPFLNGDGRFVLFSSAATNLVVNDTNNAPDVFLRDTESEITEFVSLANDQSQAQGASYAVGISSDSRYILFESFATNLIGAGEDTNAVADLFMRDRTAQSTTRVSLSWNGTQANARASYGKMTPDGMKIVFVSGATNLVEDDTNGLTDIFLRDRELSITERINLTDNGAQITKGSCSVPSVSDNGKIVAFACSSSADELVSEDTNNKMDVFVRNRLGGTTSRVSISSTGEEANGESSFPSISGNARYVAFQSNATNLVANDTNARTDIFVFDRQTNTTRRVSVGSGGTQSNGDSVYPVMNSDGRYVVFLSMATNLVTGPRNFVGNFNVYVHDLDTGTTTLVNTSSSGEEDNSQWEPDITAPSISSDGSCTAYISQGSTLVSNDTNSAWDVFVTKDECLGDPAKIIMGVCGCGLSDMDSDEDGTADCKDECPYDTAKTSVGVCGCSIADSDNNGNGVADCRDPSGLTIPSKPRVRLRPNGIVKVVMQAFPGRGVVYRVNVKRKGKIVLAKRSRKDQRTLRISSLPSGIYRLNYDILFKGMRSQLSPASAPFRVSR